MKLQGKKILLGVTGSIAAYKSAEIVRLIVREGAEVKVIMTKSAHDFITPLTMGTLSKNPVLTEFSDPSSGSWNNHVELGLWADAFLIAPISANSIAKLAHGYCEDLLSAVYLSARCPVFIAPAMDLDMFAHPATTENIHKLSTFGVTVIGPDAGELASGLSGKGRLSEPSDICSYIIKALIPSLNLKGKKVLISAGPTREAIDPVRFISNHSSGKMGVALAEEFGSRGAEVTLVAGPGVAHPNSKAITVIRINTASEMADQCLEYFPHTDITVMAAAVADYTPVIKGDRKIKKTDKNLNLELTKTTDILKMMGQRKTQNQFLVGFALETDNEIENALSKLKEKNLDLIVLNSMNDTGAGFNSDSNKITIIEKNNNITPFDLKLKNHVAADIVDKIISSLKK